MPNYQNGKIYELIDLTNNNKYYGSTVQDLKLRKSGHVRDYKQYLKKKYNYVTSFEIIKNNNYQIYLVEEFPCNSKLELEAREGYYIRNNNCVNKIIPGRTQKEWRENNREKRIQYYIDNKEKEKESIKKYKYNNKEKIKQKKKQYYIDNIEKLKEDNKQYYIDNKQKIDIKNKQYVIDNKEKIKQYQKQYRQYVNSWAGNPIYNNNLLKIDLSLFI